MNNKDIRLDLLRKLQSNPNYTQRELSQEMGISLGKVNYCMQKLTKKGWVKLANFSRSSNKLGKLEYWPDEWVPSFKYKCCPSWLKSWFEAPSIPKGARVILFHGLPNPPEAIKGRSGKWYRHIQPSPWIKDYWINNE